ncbi:MAG: caspase family protein [Nostochopsis sp.]
MAKNWAITIGVNQYDLLQPLNYAKRDAQLMQEFLRHEAGCEKIFFFSDDSPDINGKSTRPNRTNLLRLLRQLFEQPFMGAGDNFWFFFSGHGIRHTDRDYLMPCDGDPEDIENTAISINFVTERLRRCGADNIVMILDACRSLGIRAGEGIGRQTAEQARQQGVISIFSCSPQEYSYEIEALQQGAFTYALLEGLGIKGQCATVERLNQYLSFRVPELVRQHQNKRQTPYIIAEPVNKSHLILIPRYATLPEIATLKNDAYRAETERNLDLAEQLWIRVLAAASGQDIEAVRGLQRIGQRIPNSQPNISSDVVNPNSTEEQSPQPVPKPETQLHPPQTLSAGQRGRWEEQRNTLQRDWDIRSEKIKRIRKALAIENSETVKFQLEQQLQDEEAVQQRLSNELDEIDIRLQSSTTSTNQKKSGSISNAPNTSPLPSTAVNDSGNQRLKPPINNQTSLTPPSSPQPQSQPLPNLTRRRVIQYIGLAGAGLGSVILVPQLLQTLKPAQPILKTFPFQTVTVNAQGKITNRSNREAKYFVEDLGNSVNEGAPTYGSAWLQGSESYRLLRGGSWTLSPRNCRSAARDLVNPDPRVGNVGFRLLVLVA